MALVTIIAALLALTAVAFVLALNALGRAYRTLRREEAEMLAAETWPARAPGGAALKIVWKERVEASPGIEPGCKDLQSSA